MINRPYQPQRIWVAILAILFFILLVSNFAYFIGYKSLPIFETEQVKIINGTADYRSYPFDKKKNTKLKGDALFYWEKLLEPSHFTDSVPKHDALIQIPGIWNKLEIEGKKIGGFGYGTYYFRILTPDDKLYAITIKEFDCAYQMWVNGEKTSAGIVGQSKSEMKPSWKRNTVFFQPQNGQTEIIIQVSNFHHRKGGAEDPMILGRANSVIFYKHIQLGITFLLLGVLIVMLMYHLMIFINRPNDYSSLSFSAICFFFAVRLLSTGEKLIFEFFPNIDWLLAIRLEYISYKIAPPLVLLFVYHIYPKEVSKFFVKLLFVIATVFCLIVMVTPASIFSHTTSFYLPFILIITIYVLYSLFLAFIRKRPQSFIFFFGFLVFSIIVINDILFYSKIAQTDFLFPFGIFILIFSQASVLSLKSSQAFREAELYKHELEEHNKMLEQKIRKRTAQIEKAKNDLEEQACILQKTNEQLKELSSFKEGMTGMIVHDLKNPLNIILNYAKEEKVLFAARQMLNLVHNLLDLQRNEHSTMITERKTVTIKKLINQALIQVGYLFNEKQIALDNHTHDEVYINVDQNIMVRVLVNILSNALKFSPVQSTIHLSTEIIEDQIILSITDSGPGIPDDKKELIFSMFGQAIKKNLGQSESTGMGLAFCKTAIDAHGGDIGFVSEPGKGTTFWIKLLIERSEKKVIKPKTAEEDRNNNDNEVYILKQSELKRIKKHLKELSKCKVYEITKIKSIMNELEQEASDQLRKWLKMVDHAVWNGNQHEFEKLFDQLKAK